MKRIFALLVVALLLAFFSVAAARAQQLSRADKDKALELLESTKKDVLDATKGLSEAQWNFKPAPDRWSHRRVHGTHRRL
jgi:hypothetical protein